MKELKFNGPLISLNYKSVDIKTSMYLLDKRVLCRKLQTTGLIPSIFFKPISKLCIVI
jgi:hypothetical protein